MCGPRSQARRLPSDLPSRSRERSMDRARTSRSARVPSGGRRGQDDGSTTRVWVAGGTRPGDAAAACRVQVLPRESVLARLTARGTDGSDGNDLDGVRRYREWTQRATSGRRGASFAGQPCTVSASVEGVSPRAQHGERVRRSRIITALRGRLDARGRIACEFSRPGDRHPFGRRRNEPWVWLHAAGMPWRSGC